MATKVLHKEADAAVRFAKKAEQLSLLSHDSQDERAGDTRAVEARFITPRDPVIVTANGGRLPAVPLVEAQKLNQLKSEVERGDRRDQLKSSGSHVGIEQSGANGSMPMPQNEALEGTNLHHQSSKQSTEPEAPLRSAIPPSRTNPLFPPLPLYGPPTLLRNIHCNIFRFSSFFLSLGFLAVIVLGSIFTSIPLMFRYIVSRLLLKDPDARRPFYQEEMRRKKARRDAAKNFKRQRRRRNSMVKAGDDDNLEDASHSEAYIPTEGGEDPLICDVRYYARRVGLDVEEFKVHTEDGFVLELWHIYNPKEYSPVSEEKRGPHKPDVFPANQSETGQFHGASGSQYRNGNRRYPVLLVHGLLQSSGAYCTNDDDSLAFFLCKSGYDVWLGNNRCGFKPQHQLLEYSDPRMWAWNIRQMGVMDLPALISRVLSETGFEKLGLVCHSQGTTETFVALAKQQRPDLGTKISVFCALAPAAYAGPLIGKMYFKFMRVISPGMFRVFFGIHAFIPFMMSMHRLLPGKIYGALGYRVFSFLFNWTDDRWEKDLRDRMFQFAPVYVSAESMRWWLGRECFAKQKCILATREEARIEDELDDEEEGDSEEHSRGQTAWYDEQVPPFALWVCGSDQLVDGKRLLRRLERGHEPFVKLVHSKVIEEYEHLDVLWAMDSIEKVGKEVREVIWKTAAPEARELCRIPKGCEDTNIERVGEHQAGMKEVDIAMDN
ncbi:hypothetical protein MMC30_003418 [Trapelia coarctata]|nr:hypothetical protein [Trapelia coarctata]